MTGGRVARTARNSGRAALCAKSGDATAVSAATLPRARSRAVMCEGPGFSPGMSIKTGTDTTASGTFLFRRLRRRWPGLIEVAERVVEAERLERPQVDAAGLFELLRFLELLDRGRRRLGPLAVHGDLLEAFLLQRLLDLFDACRADRNRRAGEHDGLVGEDLHGAV